ncbi:MAG: hypothetical protein IT331_07740 [Anaerolineae bacterium]|nr:hypothetical protein [Anaerolineae bacterium]
MASATEPMTPLLVSELNLMHYIALLKRRWLLIIACGLIGAAAALLWTMLAPPMYAAQTELAILRTGSIVNLDPRFRTISDTDPNATGLDAAARRRSLVSIGEGAALAEQVIQKLGDRLPPALRTVEGLQEAVSIVNDGDVIRVSTRTGSPELAVLITNTWAETYVSRVNQVFGESGFVGDNLQQLSLELKQDYERKQDAVTQDRASTDIQRLKRDLDFVERQLNVDHQAKLARMLDDATALRALVAQGAGDATSSQQLAMLLLQVNLFKPDGAASADIQVPITADLSPRPQSELLKELDNLIANLKDRQIELNGPARDELFRQMNVLRAQVEVAEAKTKDLEAARDLAWNTYQLMESKVAENSVTIETQSRMVQIVSPAILPTRPLSQQTLLKTVAGALAGLVVGAVLALVLKPR